MWKLVRQPGGKGEAEGKRRPRPFTETLYDLAADPGETTDVSGTFHDVATRLSGELDAVVRPRK
jgi:hypothetical protein